jgi:hypothetical protein
MEENKKFENKSLYKQTVLVGNRAIIVMRNAGMHLETNKTYDSLKLKDLETKISIPLTEEILSAIKEAIAVKV